MPWYTYLVRCRDNSLYCGSTNNLDRRINQHNTGKGAKYVRGRTPVILVWSKQFDSRSEACKNESKIKKLSKLEKESLVIGDAIGTTSRS